MPGSNRILAGPVTIIARLLPLAVGGLFMALMPSAVSATTMTSASISITNLTITADQPFFLGSNNGSLIAKTGPDSFGNTNNDTVTVLGATAADASISTATAHAESTGTTFSNNGVMSITIPQTFNASSNVNLTTAGSFSLGSGL